MTHFLTLTNDGAITSQTALASVAHELKSVWSRDVTAANAHCESVDTTSRTHLSDSIRDTTAYGTGRLGEARTHCRTLESSRTSDGTNYVNQKKQWVDGKLATKIVKS